MSLMKEKTLDVRPSVLSSETAIKAQIVVLDQLQNLIPPPTDDELAQLEQNIRKHGVKDPLTIWETTLAIAGLHSAGATDAAVYVLVDGHNRYRLCQQYGLDYRINLVQFGSLAEVKDYMIEYQLGRRNLTTEQTSYLRGLRYIQQKSIRGSNLHADAPQVNVAQALAADYGVSSRTIKRDADFAVGVDKLTPELRRDVLTGKQKIPKSALSMLSKMPVSAPLTHVDELPGYSLTDEMDGNLAVTETDRVKTLQEAIRSLAQGSLNRKSCQQLLLKIKALLSLQTPK